MKEFNYSCDVGTLSSNGQVLFVCIFGLIFRVDFAILIVIVKSRRKKSDLGIYGLSMLFCLHVLEHPIMV